MKGTNLTFAILRLAHPTTTLTNYSSEILGLYNFYFENFHLFNFCQNIRQKLRLIAEIH